MATSPSKLAQQVSSPANSDRPDIVAAPVAEEALRNLLTHLNLAEATTATASPAAEAVISSRKKNDDEDTTSWTSDDFDLLSSGRSISSIDRNHNKHSDEDSFQEITYESDDYSDWSSDSNGSSVATPRQARPLSQSQSQSQSHSPQSSPTGPSFPSPSAPPASEPLNTTDAAADSDSDGDSDDDDATDSITVVAMVSTTAPVVGSSNVALLPIVTKKVNCARNYSQLQSKSSRRNRSHKRDCHGRNAPPAPVSAATDRDVAIIEQIPNSLWVKICSYLYPSQLARLSQANKMLYKVVTGLSCWTLWYNNRMHGLPKVTVQKIPELMASHNFMLYMCVLSLQLCEQCFRKCDGRRQPAGMTVMPLPVAWQPSSLLPPQCTQDRKQHGDKGHREQAQEKQWTIRLCLNCRKQHFEKYPEPLPEALMVAKATVYKTKREMRAAYHLGRRQFQKIKDRKSSGTAKNRGTPPVLYSEAEILRRAREMHGGDVGVQAFGNDVSGLWETMVHRCAEYHHRRMEAEQALKEGSNEK
ncbi:hypothetical protein BX616_002353 [Lobosporangium transversale]|uniref:F-box domain-containing protein n=1 Tax=Lobosporangium transversale TaxID=64571 RepID=A0A1Y2H0M8_9FUNG|nr:hypothetical protein BCR41DRAFT_344647 [Lobosporangium transversale]KAF9916950.1 hypothetical protein BX616_002353 [Lobosporangium transversale]ORZ28098.1 hypothetical protein BCR41DRAFT_344647 [Lobosporangium transversale]|eukprot:XP_021885783.1 hypothetical protein BCR41DRAFT_344647 [Lobosporangium transversale]